MRDLVAENAVSRASFDQAESMLKTAESQVESAQTQVTLGENRLSYTRLVSDVAGVVTAQGAEPGEVVGAGRMIVQVAREGARDAVFDVPARIKDTAPSQSGHHGGADRRSEGHRDRHGARGLAARRSRSPAPSASRAAQRSAAGDAPRQPRSPVACKLASAAGIEIPPSALIRADRQSAVWVVDPKTGTVATRNIEIRSSDPRPGRGRIRPQPR